MNIQDFAPVAPARIEKIRWSGERTYRVLSETFSVRWNGNLTGDKAHHVFASFEVTPEGNGAGSNGSITFSLVDLGPGDRRRYRLLLAGDQLISSANARDVEHHLLFQILSRVRFDTDDFLLMHAGSVVTPEGDGVLLPANPGDGKTTLVAGLIRAGFGFLSDEIGVFDHRSGLLVPHPRALNFKKGGLATFPDLSTSPSARRFQYLRAEEIRGDALAVPSELRFVIMPRYRKGSPTLVTPLSPAATVKELWIHTMNFSAHRDEALPILVSVARQAMGYRLVSGDLAEAVKAVNDLTGGA